MDPPPLLEIRGIHKRFPGVRALHDVRLSLHGGEVLAVVGENGAGKSTLVKILAGVQPADGGTIRLDGQVVELASVRDAQRLGIALIHQELNLVDTLGVGANIFLGREPRRSLGFSLGRHLGWIDRATIDRRSREVLARVGLEVKPSTSVRSLALGQQQLVEVAKAISVESRILIMDEPTSSLSQRESERLFEVIRALSREGVAIIYITHRLSEVERIADRVVVLRDGENAGELAKSEISRDTIVRMMVGRDVSKFYARTHHACSDPVLEIKELITAANPRHRVSATVCAGEVVGIAGLVGAGRTELLRTIFGVDRAIAGRVVVGGTVVALGDPVDAISAGIALVPEDRKSHGLLLEMSVGDNVTIAALRNNRRFAGFRNTRFEGDASRASIEELSIHTPSAGQTARLLSGGNQQKVVLGKWLATKPRVLLLDEPTRGVDVGAKHEIYRIIEQLAKRGMAILLASSEMEEIIGVCDRVLVMHEGQIAGEVGREELSGDSGEEAIMRLATGRGDRDQTIDSRSVRSGSAKP